MDEELWTEEVRKGKKGRQTKEVSQNREKMAHTLFLP